MKDQRRYEKFLFIENNNSLKSGHEGLNIVSTNITEEQKEENLKNYYTLYGAYIAISELFDCENIAMCTSFDSIFFSIPQDGWTEYTHSGPEIESPKLDRSKLDQTTPNEAIGAIIDLFLDRKKWNKQIISKELKI